MNQLGKDSSRFANPVVRSNPLFSKLLTRRVTFYRTALPTYSATIHPGGAPEWVVRNWIDLLTPSADVAVEAARKKAEEVPLLKLIEDDLDRLRRAPEEGPEDVLIDLLGMFEPEADIAEDEAYSV